MNQVFESKEIFFSRSEKKNGIAVIYQKERQKITVFLFSKWSASSRAVAASCSSGGGEDPFWVSLSCIYSQAMRSSRFLTPGCCLSARARLIVLARKWEQRNPSWSRASCALSVGASCVRDLDYLVWVTGHWHDAVTVTTMLLTIWGFRQSRKIVLRFIVS